MAAKKKTITYKDRIKSVLYSQKDLETDDITLYKWKKLSVTPIGWFEILFAVGSPANKIQ